MTPYLCAERKPQLNKGIWFSLLSVVMMSLAGPLYKSATLTASIEAVVFYSCLSVLPGSFFLISFSRNWRFRRKSIFPVLLLSSLYTTAMLSFAFAAKYENPAIISLIARSNVIFSFIISFLYFKDHFTAKIGLGILFILTGTFLLISDRKGISVTIGTFLILYYALAFSIHNGVLKTLEAEDFMLVLLTQNLLAVLGIFIFTSDFTKFFQIPLESVALSVLAGVLSSFLGSILYQKGLRISSFSEVTAVRSLSPLIALIVTYPFFPFEFDRFKIIGSALILLGVLIFNLHRKPAYD